MTWERNAHPTNLIHDKLKSKLFGFCCTLAGKLFYTSGNSSPQDRDKIIIQLNFDVPTTHRLQQIIDAVEQMAGVPLRKKFREPHMIISKNYDALKVRPDDELLKR